MIDIHLDIISIVIGFLIGTTISFLAFWIVETINYNNSKWSVGFDKGWHEYKKMIREFSNEQ